MKKENIECNHCGRDNLEFADMYRGDNGYLECPHCGSQFISIPNKIKDLWRLYIKDREKIDVSRS